MTTLSGVLGCHNCLFDKLESLVFREARNKLLNFKSLRMKSSISSLIVVKGAYGFRKSVWTDGKSRKSMV